MSLTNEIESFLFGVKKFPLILITILHTMSSIRCYLILLSEKMYFNKNNWPLLSIIIHHHTHKWIPNRIDFNFYLLAYPLITTFNSILLLMSINLRKENKFCDLLLQPIRLIDCCNINVFNLKNSSKSRLKLMIIIFSKNVNKFMFAYIFFIRSSDIIYSFKDYLNLSVKCYFNLFFSFLDSYLYFKINTYTFILIYFNCDLINSKINKFHSYSTGCSFESNLSNLVSLVTEIRQLNFALQYLLGPFLIRELCESTLMTYGFITVATNRSLMLVTGLFIIINTYIFVTIKSLSSVHATFVSAFDQISHQYLMKKSLFSFHQLIKYNYVLNNCRYNNSFTFLKSENINRDFFRKASIWLIINTIRLNK